MNLRFGGFSGDFREVPKMVNNAENIVNYEVFRVSENSVREIFGRFSGGPKIQSENSENSIRKFRKFKNADLHVVFLEFSDFWNHISGTAKGCEARGRSNIYTYMHTLSTYTHTYIRKYVRTYIHMYLPT